MAGRGASAELPEGDGVRSGLLQEEDPRLRAARLTAMLVFQRGLETLAGLMGIPAPAKMVSWIGQVGSLSQTPRPGRLLAMNSAARRRAPVPPGVWVAPARPAAISGLPVPSTSSSISWPNAVSPWPPT